MDPLISQVEATLKKYRMALPGERLGVACSGGGDSVALFHLLREVAPRLGFRLGLLHFDHRQRQGSAKDYRFVRSLARESKVPFYGGRNAGLKKEKDVSPEEDARRRRYAFFEKVARRRRIRKIILGHHRDDQAETVLMRLLQGTGPRGLQGMRPVVIRRGVTYLHPLLEVGRAELRKFLKRRSLPFREDPTNRLRRFLRNRIRHELLPWLEQEFNPKIREALLHLAQTVATESKEMEAWFEAQAKACVEKRRDGTLWLDRIKFLALPGPLQFRLLDRGLRMLDFRSGLDFKAWEKMREGLPKGRFRKTFPHSLELTLTQKKLFIRKSDRIKMVKAKNKPNLKQHLRLGQKQ